MLETVGDQFHVVARRKRRICLKLGLHTDFFMFQTAYGKVYCPNEHGHVYKNIIECDMSKKLPVNIIMSIFESFQGAWIDECAMNNISFLMDR